MNYTLLFKYMCQSIGVKAEVIDGRIKSSAKEIKGSYIGVNHAWSAVQLEDKWYLLDLTLASGFVRKNCSEFVKEFRDEYFMVPPQQFIHTHLPKSPKWQHLRSKVKQKEFMALPYAAYGAHKFGVSQMSPKQGTLTSDTTSFRIELQHLEIFDRVVLYEDDLTIFPNVSLEDQTLSFDYFRNKPDAKYLSIHFETLEKSFLVLRYKLD